MELGRPGWLFALLDAEVAAFRAEPVLEKVKASKLASPRAKAREWFGRALRESGLLYGSPSKDAAVAGPKEEKLFLAVLRALVRLSLELAVVLETPPGPRREQTLLIVAATFGALDDAEDLHKRIERASRQWPLPEKVWRRVEEAVEARAISLSGDPYYGLVLHNGALYADAHLLGRVALSYFSRPSFPREHVERRVRFAAQQKALLVETLIGLACAERKPSYPARRAILRQIDDLQLPEELEDQVKTFARRAFERTPNINKVLTGVKSRGLKHFLLEQTLLASLVDGQRSAREQQWLKELAKTLVVAPAQVRALELQVAEFYAKNRDVVDVFTVGAGADVMGEELVDKMQTTLMKNFQRLLQEMKETGDMSVLLARAARGQELTAAEKKRMREQLLDVAKAIPALAIFAAPGGVLLLIALAKVLPFSLLPSSFKDDAANEDEAASG